MLTLSVISMARLPGSRPCSKRASYTGCYVLLSWSGKPFDRPEKREYPMYGEEGVF